MSRCGIGWRHPHTRELLQRLPPLPFIEVHSENFFGAGGAARAALLAARTHYPVSLHGVGLGLGSEAGLDEAHLAALADLVDTVQPLRVSDHACWARAGAPAQHGLDLLPLPFDDTSLARLGRHVAQVQQRLRRPLLVEHLSAYLAWDSDTLAEPEFFNALTAQTGCQLLLDVNNLVVNARNRGHDPLHAGRAWIDALRPGSVGEVHLAGHCVVDGLAIDDHGSAVEAVTWALWQHAQQHLGPLPGLVEWDTDIPALEVLLAEAARADSGLAA